MDDKTRYAQLTTEPVGKLLAKFAWPAIIAMTASSLYNMVDSIFIGHGVGPLAISGIAVTFPLMNLSTALGTLVGVGAATLISVLLGQKNYVKANSVLANLVILCSVIALLFTAVTMVFLDPILYFFGASAQTISYARDYMGIILAGNVVTHLYFGLNNLLRACGDPKKAMGATLFTVTINTILDPIFIFSFGMGIKGAAIATVLSQTMALTWILYEFSKKKRLIRFRRESFKIDARISKDLLTIGMAPFLMNAAACLIVIVLNKQMARYGGDLAIGAYGIVNRISFLFVMVVIGLNQGMQPIAGYNYGARLYSRVREVFGKTVKYATIITSAGFAIGMLIPETAVSLFTTDAELLDKSAAGLRITTLIFPLIGFQIVTSQFFQSMGMSGKAIILSLARQIIFLLPCIFLLPLTFKDKPILGVWASFPFSDFLATILAFLLLRGLMHKFDKLKDGDDPVILGGI